MSEKPPYTTSLSLKCRKALLEALNQIAIETHSDTAIWGSIDKKGNVRFWQAPHLCKKSEKSREDFVEQFDSHKMAEQILAFIERGYI